MRIGLAGAGRIGRRHAQTLCGLAHVESLVVADTVAGRARELADRHGRCRHQPHRPWAEAVDSVAELFAAGVDGLVVAAATDAHADLVKWAAAKRLPVFCEKPIALDIAGTRDVIDTVRAAGIRVQIGFQRRFDAGHAVAREAVAAGRLGWLHTIRSCTLDPAPPPAAYIPASGGLFRDCAVHDFDGIRWVTGREVVQVVAMGANRGERVFRDSGDVDTGAALLTLDDGTLAVVSATRYNAAGYDVRLELLGSKDSLVAGFDERTPLAPADPTRAADPPADSAADSPADSPAGAAASGDVAYTCFLDRFADAYAAELEAFTGLVAGRIDSPCSPEDALEAFYVAEACERSRREGRLVPLEEVRQ